MAKDTTPVEETVVVDAPVAAPAKDACTDCTGYCQVCGATKVAE